MTSLRRTLGRFLRGPIGGAFLCLLIALFLGGVAMAHPGDKGHGPASSETSDAPTDAPQPREQDQGGQGGGGGGQQTHTAADCRATLTDVQGTLPAVQDATGLAHAIWVVEGNCEKNPQAPGLVNALNHLVANWQRQQAHEAGNGNGGQHGPPAVHGNSGAHGNSGVHGNSADHGNPHGSSDGGS